MLAESHLLATLRRLDDRGGRDATGWFTIERYTAFVRAIDDGADLVGIVVCKKLVTSSLCQMLVRRAKNRGVPTLFVDPETFRRHSHAARASGVIAVVRQPWLPLEQAPPGTWLALDRMRHPGNVGCILRTAGAAGTTGLLLIGDDVDPFAPDVLGSALGGAFGLAFVRTTWPALRAWARGHGMPLVAASPAGAVPWDAYPWPEAMVLCLGEEREGLPPEVIASCDATVSIPLCRGADSLNVATAAGILLFEAIRFRRATSASREPPLRDSA
jgi:TrmH family RNA methyltransferase